MDGDRVGDVWEAGIREAGSASWAQRAAAGRSLARWADLRRIGPVLERLLLDAEDTGVTQETAQALLERCDLVGVRAVLGALSRAEEWSTADQLAGEVFGFQNWMLAAGRRDEFTGLMTALASDQDPGVREEAQYFLGS